MMCKLRDGLDQTVAAPNERFALAYAQMHEVEPNVYRCGEFDVLEDGDGETRIFDTAKNALVAWRAAMAAAWDAEIFDVSDYADRHGMGAIFAATLRGGETVVYGVTVKWI